jgi:3-methylfumaryl-CoA hydratase
MYFLDAPPTAAVGRDGRTVADGLLPETGLPRRMWAGGELICHRPLVLGATAKSEVRIAAIEEKEGGSGRLTFLDLRFVLSDHDGPAVEEHRDIVMREAPAPGETPRRRDPPTGAQWRREMTPNHLMLFRFSALTFNGHRIHYDADYVRQVEGYPDLLVHGPLLALLLLDLVRCSIPEAAVRRFRYRAVAPLFVSRPLALCGKTAGTGRAELWGEGDDGRLATWAEVELA